MKKIMVLLLAILVLLTLTGCATEANSQEGDYYVPAAQSGCGVAGPEPTMVATGVLLIDETYKL